MRLRGKVFIIKKITGIIKNDFLEILQITPFTSKNTRLKEKTNLLQYFRFPKKANLVLTWTLAKSNLFEFLTIFCF